MNGKDKKIYILLTRFPDKRSRVLSFFTNCYYTHTAIALEEDMNTFYSFNKKGFFIETITRYMKAGREPFPCRLYELDVTEAQYSSLKKTIEEFETQKSVWKYARAGLVFGLLHIPFKQKYRYTCSHFVAEALKRSNAAKIKKHTSLYYPKDISKLKELVEIFQGNLKTYIQRFQLSPQST